ncbi:MAG: DUF5916 domain-containing protein [Thermodesulfobacteriota bacterium]
MRFLIYLFFITSFILLKKSERSPIIDGEIESSWQYGDSTNLFIQWTPIEKALTTEPTKAYILCDKENVYVAFKCFDSYPQKLNIKKTFRDYGDCGDKVWILIDSNKNHAMGYLLGVNVGGVQFDAVLYQDGRDIDYSWDGVWYSAVKITDYGYNVEMKIPFKTLRFKPGLNEWGINFFRYIARKDECVSWAPLKQSEGIRVSRCGILKGINPGKQGLHLELYPVGLLSYELESVCPKAGLDLNWGFPTSQFSLTTYPDFAQIEADPYTINLSKYEIYFPERRPFFIEGQEFFDTPIRLFYSRRIGKRIWVDEDVKEIPIIGGAKYTGTVGRANFGLLSAYTDKVGDEPKTLYSVGRIKLGILKNSEAGVLYSEARDEIDKQRVAGIDMALRTTELQLQSQIAHSDSGNAGVARLDWNARKFIIISQYEKYDKEFNIDRIGFAPWKGRTSYYLMFGPRWFNKSIFRRLNIRIMIGSQKEVDEPKSEYYGGLQYSSEFTNKLWSSIKIIGGKEYEMNEYYDYCQLQTSLWTDQSKPFVISCDASYTSYGYNYRRSYFGPTSQNSFSIEWRVSPPLSLLVDISNTIEWKPNKELEAVSWVFRPILQYAITRDMHIRVYTEPNTDTHIHQFNALFSYNFRPKSWFYIALNEARDNTEGKMVLSNRIGVIKLRYLFFW